MIFIAAAVQDDVPDFPGQFLERGVDVEIVVLGQRLDNLEIVGIAPVPAAHGAAGRG